VQARIVGSFAVVLIALVPTLVGGPVFALLLVLLGIIGFREYLDLATRVGPPEVAGLAGVGVAAVAAFALAAQLGGSTLWLLAATAVAIVAPLLALFASPATKGAFQAWSLVSVGCLYLGLPVFSAILLRSTPGDVGARWLEDLAGRLSLGWTPYPRGLAWSMLVILSIWISDTAAYLAGRAMGRHKLAPRISPGKTVEGAVAGLIGSAAIGALAFHLFALGSPWVGVAAGGLIGAAGQFGDLAESFLKRQAGVKDSGSLIPGHGGLLDRIDALLFAFPVGLIIAVGVDWWQLR
jgi:phosphatidate cytidylyltransferase